MLPEKNVEAKLLNTNIQKCKQQSNFMSNAWKAGPKRKLNDAYTLKLRKTI